MRLETFTLRGFTRFKQAVTVDLRDLPSGLIAIVGPNRAGKTTLLEAATGALYREFMSRGELLKYANSDASLLEATFGFDGGGTYRSVVHVNKPKRSTIAVLQEITADGSATELNDGKVTTYDEAIAAHFPPRDQLLASAFAAQDRAGSFIHMEKSKRKDLFAGLLGIARYQTMSETARQCAALVDQARGQVQAQLAILAGDVSDAVVNEIDTRAQNLQVELGRAEIERGQVGAAMEELQARLDLIGDAVAAHAAARQALQQATANLERVEGDARRASEEVGAEQVRHNDELAAIAARHDRSLRASGQTETTAVQRIKADMTHAKERLDQVLADVERRRAGNQKLKAMEKEIREAVTRSADLLAQDVALQTEIRLREEALDRNRLMITNAAAELGTLDVTLRNLERAERDQALLATVPCGGQGVFAACSFLTSAVEASNEIPALRTQVAPRELKRMELAAAREDTDSLQQARQALGRTLAAVHGEIRRLAPLVEYLAPLEANAARMQELDTQATTAHGEYSLAIDRLNQAVLVAQEEATERENAIHAATNGDVAAETDRHAQRLADAEARVTEAERSVAALWDERAAAQKALDAATAGNTAATGLADDLRAQRLRWDALTGAVARAVAAGEELERRRSELTRKRHQVAALQATRARLDQELVDWQTHARAFGRDGLAVLEIDAAGPTISAYTNQLLEVCFGPVFSVELITQQAKADGKGMKEDFTILVTDNARGGERRDIADLSGGEKVIIAEALSNAICIYVNTRSTSPIRTCWRDETTGALDADNAVRYVQMLRKMQELGGFHQVLFITHIDDIKVLADAQIRVAIEDGTVAVAEPPYEEEA